jgi:hypothetical protein
MAYAFSAASSRHLTTNSAPVTETPLTMCAWFNTFSGGVAQGIMSLSNTSNGQFFRMALDGSSRVIANAGFNVSVSAAYTSGLWAHSAAVFESSVSRQAYLNGVAGSANTTSFTPTGISSVFIGANSLTSVAAPNNGRIAECGIWNAVLTSDEIAALSRGLAPDKVRPQSLVFYAPLIRDLVDLRGGLALTNINGATATEHPRIYA